jgi:UDP-N-acetylglucosamine acyltransferase
MAIHPTAIVDPAAEIDPEAEIGPYCVIGAGVTIGARTSLKAHVYLEGKLTIGSDNAFFPYVSCGVAPQDKKYRGEPSETRIGNGNSIRECVTIHRGTEGGGMITSIGDGNLLMAYVHVAHDVIIAHHTILANSVTFAGHVRVDEYANIGRHAMVGSYSVITQDVLPFSTIATTREVKVYGANRVGLERRGYSALSIEPLQNTFRILTRAGLNTSQAVARIQEEVPDTPEVREVLEFIASSSQGFVK